MRVVLDTNVLVSALLFKQHALWVMEAVERGGLVPCVSKETIQEFARVLQYKKFTKILSSEKLTVDDILRYILNYAYIVHSSKAVSVIEQDPSDNAFLSCAEAARAQCIISGDTHLLTLRIYKNIPIYTLSEAREALNL